MQPTIDAIRDQLQKIERRGALGRSRSYLRLLEFFVDCWVKGRTPKELEIAFEVFGKGADFDPSQDSMVRVYAHNLRQKLERYYATDGAAEPQRLSLPRGEYRLALISANGGAQQVEPAPLAATASELVPASAVPPSVKRTVGVGTIAAAATLLLVIGVCLGFAVDEARKPSQTGAQIAAVSAIWSTILADGLPLTVVVGDYYIFGELDKNGSVERLVRDFSVNSSKDLDELIMYNPELLGKYMDLDLTYLPRGSAFALLDVLRVMYTSNKPIRIVSMTDFNIADLKSSHVVYLGYISALDKLEDFVFASSGLSVGATYDELRNSGNGDIYLSDASVAVHHNFRDYGLISTFPGPGGNQFLVVAGMRDAGMMQAAHALADPAFLASVEDARPDAHGPQPPSFEMLYEVMGYAGTNLDAVLVHKAKLDYQKIWGGNFLHANATD